MATTIITCKPPPSQPHALTGSGLPQVLVSACFGRSDFCFLFLLFGFFLLLLKEGIIIIHCTYAVLFLTRASCEGL